MILRSWPEFHYNFDLKSARHRGHSFRVFIMYVLFSTLTCASPIISLHSLHQLTWFGAMGTLCLQLNSAGLPFNRGSFRISPFQNQSL